MAKSRRGVQFQHRSNGDANGRRPSTISEDASDSGSPTLLSADGKAEVSKVEVDLTFKPSSPVKERQANQEICTERATTDFRL